MARPIKIEGGLPYFPLRVDLSEADDRMRYLEDVFGQTPFNMYIKILGKIYNNCYYRSWSDRDLVSYCIRAKVELPLGKEVFAALMDEGFFHKDLFEEYRVLTSNGTQKRFLEAARRRAVIEITAEYWRYKIPPTYPAIDRLKVVNIKNEIVIDSSVLANILQQKPSIGRVNVVNNSLGSELPETETGFSDDINSQSKEEKSRVKDSITNYLSLARELKEQFRESDFRTIVMPFWASTRPGNFYPQSHEPYFFGLWQTYGSLALVEAMHCFSIGGYQKPQRIAEALDPANPFTWKSEHHERRYSALGIKNRREQSLDQLRDKDYFLNKTSEKF